MELNGFIDESDPKCASYNYALREYNGNYPLEDVEIEKSTGIVRFFVLECCEEVYAEVCRLHSVADLENILDLLGIDKQIKLPKPKKQTNAAHQTSIIKQKNNMTKEEIIATAIHEAFLCGKEAGEESQRQWYSMQQKIEGAKQRNSVIDDMAKHDGFLPQVELAKLKEENEKLGKILEERDATITELRRELQANKDADTLLCDGNKRLVASLNEKESRPFHIHWRTLNETPTKDTWIVYLQEQSYTSPDEKPRYYCGKSLSIRLFRGAHIEFASPMEPHLLGWAFLSDFIPEGSMEDVTDKVVIPVEPQADKEPSPCIDFSEGEQVLVSGKFFGDFAGLFQGIILEVMREYARVLITEKDSDFEDDEPFVPFEYITKA